jgi:hypothetical protein
MAARLKPLAAATLLATCLLAHSPHASQVGPLTTFVPGTTAKASEVNGNFSALVTAVNDNDAHITALQSNPQVAGNITLGGNITLPEPSTATAGNVLKGASSFLHDFGTRNTFLGVAAGNFAMLGADNTAVGFNALAHNAGDGAETASSPGLGDYNTAIGSESLLANTTGSGNTASGAAALQNNTTGSSNTACGAGALQTNTTGGSNTASGADALSSNTTGAQNTASGGEALLSNTTGASNTASGANALYGNTSGGFNAASGAVALFSNTTGGSNTASGYGALYANTTGSNNTAVGYGALGQLNGAGPNTALGYSAGYSLTSGINNIYIANGGVATESATTRIGDSNQTSTFISGIYGTTASAGVPVLVNASGQLGTMSSSRRVKDHIADMGEASSALMELRPVTFYYRADHNPQGRTLQYGLVAEEVADVLPGLVGRSGAGRVETVYYQFLAPMLLNEVQKQQRQIEAQAAVASGQRERIGELERDRRELLTRIEALEQRTERLAGLLEQLEVARR